jgi:hypothetical protein
MSFQTVQLRIKARVGGLCSPVAEACQVNVLSRDHGVENQRDNSGGRNLANSLEFGAKRVSDNRQLGRRI